MAPIVNRFQGLLYFVLLALFVSVATAQMHWRPTRVDRPENNFGGNFVFFTVQTNFIILAYVGICAFDYIFCRRVQRLARTVERLTGTVCALGFIMGSLYYLLIHFHPMTRARAAEIEHFDWYMHFLHGTPLVFAVCEALFRERPAYRPIVDVLGVNTYILMYTTWTLACVWMNDGWWPYAFQQRLKVWQHLVFELGVVLVIVPSAVLLLGHLVRGRAVQLVKRKNRRRVRASATKAAAESARATSSTASTVVAGEATPSKALIESYSDVIDSCTDVIDSCSTEVARGGFLLL